jgi:hypothetical protein
VAAAVERVFGTNGDRDYRDYLQSMNLEIALCFSSVAS